MQIFIDESGPFVVPTTSQWSVCCISALTIPDAYYPDEITKQFEILRSSWGVKGKEIKGKELNEHQVSAVIQLLARYEVVFETIAIDMGLQTLAGIRQHKLRRAQSLAANLTAAHQPPFVEALRTLQSRLQNTPDQLYVQSVLSGELIGNTLQKTTAYYSQRKPNELGNFRWVVDAKDTAITPYEDLWSNMVMPTLQSRFLFEPLVLVPGADYSAFAKYCGIEEEVPLHLRDAVGERRPFHHIKLEEVMKDLSFARSDDEIGLQLADILCNAVRRAMNGRLRKLGWEFIGCLTVQSEKGKHAIRLLDLTASDSWGVRGAMPYVEVIRLADRTARTMLQKSTGH